MGLKMRDIVFIKEENWLVTYRVMCDTQNQGNWFEYKKNSEFVPLCRQVEAAFYRP